jgi:energy-coupling factor transport system permease protein
VANSLGFGTYIPGTSPVHTLNAQVKIILACVFSIAVFFVEGWIGLGLLVAFVVLLYLLAQVRITRALSGLKPIIFILAFTVLVHMFSISLGTDAATGGNTMGSLGLTQQWVLFGSFGITLDGLVRGLYFALRISMLVAVCSLLTFTTSMVALTDGLLHLMSPLRKVGAPIDDLAMMISIALRFIPTTAQEAQCVVKAQKARCADFESGGFLARAKAWVPVFIPLFVRLFRRADELALAMDARCYRGAGRTHMHEESMTARDGAVLAAVLVVLVAVCILL